MAVLVLYYCRLHCTYHKHIVIFSEQARVLIGDLNCVETLLHILQDYTDTKTKRFVVRAGSCDIPYFSLSFWSNVKVKYSLEI